MTSLLSLLVLRPLLAKPRRLVARYLAYMILLTVPDLLLRWSLDADLPRAVLLALLAVLAAAWLFLRASWRRRREAHGTPRTRRTAVVFDRYRRPPAGAGGAHPAGSGPGRISRR
ncbi:MAG TPA: hypothetical protein VJA16_15080 [Thermoanaerobaculia bacterium]